MFSVQSKGGPSGLDSPLRYILLDNILVPLNKHAEQHFSAWYPYFAI